MAVKKYGVVTYSLIGSHCTVSDLKDFISELESLSVPDDYVLEHCDIKFRYRGDVDTIIDGESLPGQERNDILLIVDFDE